jgi:hypothetical protein
MHNRGIVLVGCEYKLLYMFLKPLSKTLVGAPWMIPGTKSVLNEKRTIYG